MKTIGLSKEETDALRTAVSQYYDQSMGGERTQLEKVLAFLQISKRVTIVDYGMDL